MKFYEKVNNLGGKYPCASDIVITEFRKYIIDIIEDFVNDRERYDMTELRFDQNESVSRYEFNRVYNPNDPEWQKKIRPYNEVIDAPMIFFGENITGIELSVGDLYDNLLEATSEDEISFTYLRYCIINEFASVNKLPLPQKDFPPYCVIAYSIKYDFEETVRESQKISLLDKRAEYLRKLLMDSRLCTDVAQDEKGSKIKSVYEERLKVLIEVTETKLKEQRNLSSSTRPQMHLEESVERLEMLENGETDHYLTYYDFNNCPIELRAEPFSVNLLDHRITKTVRGLEDANVVLKEIFKNLYRELVFVNTDGAKDIYDQARNLLKSLYALFLRSARALYKNDNATVIQLSKWWSMNTANTISYALEDADISETQTYDKYCNLLPQHSAVTKNLLHFKKTMVEYSIYLTVLGMYKLPDCLDVKLQGIVPFNYYGGEFAQRLRVASEKRIKNEEDKVVTEYLKNCGQLSTFILEIMEEFKGLVSNDTATSKKKHGLANLFIDMANDYITRVERAVPSDSSKLKFAFGLWHWILKESLNNVVSYLTSQNQCTIGHLEYSSNWEAGDIVESTKCYTSTATVILKAITNIQVDFEKSLPSEKTDKKEDRKTDFQTKGSDSVEPVLFTATINYAKMLAEVNGKCFKNVSREEFEKAIKTGNISLLKAKVDNMGYHSGAVGALKWFIKILSTRLGKKWYKKAAESIGLNTQKIDKVNTTTDAVKSLNIDKILKCIEL